VRNGKGRTDYQERPDSLLKWDSPVRGGGSRGRSTQFEFWGRGGEVRGAESEFIEWYPAFFSFSVQSAPPAFLNPERAIRVSN